MVAPAEGPAGTALVPGTDDHPTIAPGVMPALKAILRDGTPRQTARAFAHALRYWSAWHALRMGRPLPYPAAAVAPETVLTFIADHAPSRDEHQRLTVAMPAHVDAELVRLGVKSRPGLLSHNTVKQRIALLGALHQRRGLANPMTHEAVRNLRAAVDNTAKHYDRLGKPKPAFPETLLAPLMAGCGDTLIGKRDRALLCVIYFSGGRRRSEIGTLTHADCARYETGYLLTFRFVKSRKEPLVVPLVADGAHALDAWLSILHENGITAGPVFCDVRGEAHPHFGRAGLSGHAVARLLARRLRDAGLPVTYTPHSFRSGFTTARLGRGESYAQVQAMTGHADPRTMTVHYYRPADQLNNPAAQPDPAPVDLETTHAGSAKRRSALQP